jgi:hypothetical protein
MYRAKALKRLRLEETMHGIPISSVAPRGDIGNGPLRRDGVSVVVVVVVVVGADRVDLVMVSADPFRLRVLRLAVDSLPEEIAVAALLLSEEV